LTFNTTSLPLLEALQKKLLLEREPLRSLGDFKRHVLLDPRIDALLDGHVAFGVFPATSAERLIAEFSAGWLLRVSRKRTKWRPNLEQLEGYDEVWALCPRRPPPGWRILGRFYDKDVFVGLRAWDKGVLYSRYAEAAQEVIEDWNELFGNQPPHRGQGIGDYVSPVWEDIDEAN
jgi:hypothetical protein